ncbi:lactonase family protein [Streptomyces tricolor]|nr:lactonase family protein [Streptomyces tricolor]
MFVHLVTPPEWRRITGEAPPALAGRPGGVHPGGPALVRLLRCGRRGPRPRGRPGARSEPVGAWLGDDLDPWQAPSAGQGDAAQGRAGHTGRGRGVVAAEVARGATPPCPALPLAVRAGQGGSHERGDRRPGGAGWTRRHERRERGSPPPRRGRRARLDQTPLRRCGGRHGGRGGGSVPGRPAGRHPDPEERAGRRPTAPETVRPAPAVRGHLHSVDGGGTGIGLASYDPESGRITGAGTLTGSPDPSYLAVHPTAARCTPWTSGRTAG